MVAEALKKPHAFHHHRQSDSKIDNMEFTVRNACRDRCLHFVAVAKICCIYVTSPKSHDIQYEIRISTYRIIP